MTGTVKWFDAKKGFGFIECDEKLAGKKGNNDVFVHYTAISGDGYRELVKDQRVQFEVSQSQKGLQAEDVQVIG